MRTFPKPNDHYKYDRLPILVVDVPPLGFGQGGLAQHTPNSVENRHDPTAISGDPKMVI